MAYATGSGTTATEFLQAMVNFATAQGWTASTGSVQANGRANFFANFQKGLVYANFNLDTRQINHYTGNRSTGGYVNEFDQGIIGALCTGFTTDLYYSNTNSPSQGNQGATVYDLNNIQGWFFFSGGVNDPSYIHAVIQTAADRFAHISIGQLDQKGLTHGGAAYMTSGRNLWYQDSFLDSGPGFNQPVYQGQPFIGGYNNQGYVNVYPADALPVDSQWPVILSFPNGQYYFIIHLATISNIALAPYSNGAPCGLCECINMSTPSTYSGYTMLWALPCIAKNTINQDMVYIGDYPNVRGCNMETLSPGQEISLVSDTWKVFPVLRQSSFATSQQGNQPSSGQYAIAYKKIV